MLPAATRRNVHRLVRLPATTLKIMLRSCEAPAAGRGAAGAVELCLREDLACEETNLSRFLGVVSESSEQMARLAPTQVIKPVAMLRF